MWHTALVVLRSPFGQVGAHIAGPCGHIRRLVYLVFGCPFLTGPVSQALNYADRRPTMTAHTWHQLLRLSLSHLVSGHSLHMVIYGT